MTVDDRIPELLRRVDLAEQVVRLGAVESNRPGLYGCPNPGHEDRHPSFTVKDGRWRCWSVCDASGDAIDLLVWLRGMTKAEAIDELAAMVGLERDRNPGCYRSATSACADRDLLIGWCRRRGWGPWVPDELGLSVVADAYGRRRIRFPFRLAGHVPYYQDRAVDDSVKLRWLSPRGARPVPYEADRLKLARERGHIFIVEGVTDVVALVDTYTAPAVVGIPGVAAWRPGWARAFAGLGVYVVADNDQAGERFRARIGDDLRFMARAVWQVPVPPEHNDVAGWRRNLDPEEFDAEMMAAIEAAAGHHVEMAG